MILFIRDDCGPIETINKTSICPKFENEKLHYLGSAKRRMEDDQVADRELQATTERKKCTLTISMTVKVDLGSSRAARKHGALKPEFATNQR